LHILNLAVHPLFRGQGIAHGLICEAIGLARANNIQTAWLEVRTSNREALSLYQSMGFKPVMTRKRYYSDTGEDAFILSCFL
jgi:[ribosomal protein S18]-alanine N-acetyltransferase